MKQSKSQPEQSFVLSFCYLMGALAFGGLVMNHYLIPPVSHGSSDYGTTSPSDSKDTNRHVFHQDGEARDQAAANSVVVKKESPDNELASAPGPTHTSPGPINPGRSASQKPSSLPSPSAPTHASSLKEAMRLVDAGRPGEAIGLLEKILQNDPTNEAALTELGMVYLIDLKEPELAIGYLERVIATNPNNKVVLAELVGLYEEREQNGVGLSFLQEVYEKNPKNSTLAMGIGQMLAANEQGEEAIPYLEKAVKLGTAQASTELADVYAELGQSEKARQYYELSAKNAGSKEEKVMALVDLISHHLENGQYQEAEKVFLRIDLPESEGSELLAQFREEIERHKQDQETDKF